MEKDKLVENNLLSDNERIKFESNYLRGSIVDDLKDDLTGGFSADNYQLIRFHGMYEQDNRDIRSKRLEQKLDTLKNIMLRCRLPGGIISTDQWLGIDDFARKHTLYGSIRLTTRQTFQFHGVLKPDIKPMHKFLNSLGLDSIATAGDVNRNVLCTSNPVESNLHKEAYEWAKKISEHLLPKTRAYAEIWLDKKKIETTDKEPILGKTYLPRKFKTAIAIPPNNDVDIHANDLIFVAIGENNKLIGFNVLVGGGLSIEHGNKKTYPNTAYDFGFVALENVLNAAEGVVLVQKDWGNRSDRKNAKTRYTLQKYGVDNFKYAVESKMGFKFLKSKPFYFKTRGDNIGWVKGEEGNWHLTLFIQNGRILDYPLRPLKTGLREIAKSHKGDFRLTANQNLIVANVLEKDKLQIENLARKYKLIDDNISLQRKNSMACVSFPTCPLAMAESERFLPTFLDKIEKIMQENNLSNDYIVLRITGCPNGCARAMLAEVGLVGKALGRYNLFLGGDRIGNRIPRMYKENITENEILEILNNLISKWAKERDTNEEFGNFVIRSKIIEPVLNPPVDFWV